MVTMSVAWSRKLSAKMRLRATLSLLTAGLVGTSFSIGYKTSSYRQVRTNATAAVPIAQMDFLVSLPEGSTEITITDSDANNTELARFVVTRQLDVIEGVPERRRTILPRASLSPDDAAFFRHELSQTISASDSKWDRAQKIRNWLAKTRHATALPGLKTRIPREAYLQMRQGKPVLCGNLAEIYVALCQSVGLVARAVGLSFTVRDGTFGVDTHAGAEVWIPEMGGWIYQDPTFNCYWLIDGRAASALQLHNALMNGADIELMPHDQNVKLSISKYYVNPRLLFRHISYEYKAGGPLLYYLDDRIAPLNLYDRNWIQTEDQAAFEKLDTNGNDIIERKREIVPGIFVQVIGTKLFVRDRREGNRGLRLRSSTGIVRVCAYEHSQAQQLGVFQAKNLIRNGSFSLIDQQDGIAEHWTVSGPVEALTTLGGQGMAARSGGRLYQHIAVEAGKRYVMFARLSIRRGALKWTFADTNGGLESTGSKTPTQITEILSDVVESTSGYLDVAFELTESGAFRVMEVVVTELPLNGLDNLQRILPEKGSREIVSAGETQSTQRAKGYWSR